MLCMLALSGCSVCQILYVNFFFEESVTSKKLKEMGSGEYKYLKDIYNEQWQKFVCGFLIPRQLAVHPLILKSHVLIKKQVVFV